MIQTLTRRSNAFDVNDETGGGDRKRGTNQLSASKLLAEKRPLTSEEQALIVTEAEESLLANDRIATTAFSLIIAAEGFVFFFFAVADFRTFFFKAGGANELDVALKTGGGVSSSSVDVLFEALSHLVVCTLAFLAVYKTRNRKSLKKIVVHKLLSASAAMLNRNGGGDNCKRPRGHSLGGGSRRSTSKPATSRSQSSTRRAAGCGGTNMTVTTDPPPPLLNSFPPPPPGLVELDVPPPSLPHPLVRPLPPPPPPPPSFRGSSLLESVTSPDPRHKGSAGGGGGDRDYFNDETALLAEEDHDNDDDDEPSISIALHDDNIRIVQTTHRQTAVLSLFLAAPLIIVSTLLSSSGESIFAARRLLLCVWQPVQHFTMAWAARSLVEDVVVSIAQLKKSRYKYQDA